MVALDIVTLAEQARRWLGSICKQAAAAGSALSTGRARLRAALLAVTLAQAMLFGGAGAAFAASVPHANGDTDQPAYASYRVQAGDTLSGIAKKFSAKQHLLAMANNVKNPNKLLPGQTILVPEQKASGGPGVSQGTVDRAAPASTPDPGSTNPQSKASDATAVAAGADRRDAPSPSARGARPLESWQEGFLETASEAARFTQEVTGVPASVTIAQAILESDWGRATIKEANNYFGIKAQTKPGPAGVVWANTKEYTGKDWITVKAPFRAYENMAQSFIDHALFFIENDRYAAAMQASDARAFAREIHKAGYATDPQYAQSLIKLMDRFDLYRHDRPISDADDGHGDADGKLPDAPGVVMPEQSGEGSGRDEGPPARRPSIR